MVSDEVGSGIVPMHAGARAYRDLVGIAHQRLAAQADEVYLLVAGLPVTLKGGGRTMTTETCDDRSAPARRPLPPSGRWTQTRWPAPRPASTD